MMASNVVKKTSTGFNDDKYLVVKKTDNKTNINNV